MELIKLVFPVEAGKHLKGECVGEVVLLYVLLHFMRSAIVVFMHL